MILDTVEKLRFVQDIIKSTSSINGKYVCLFAWWCYRWCWEFESPSERGVQHYVINFVSDLRQVSSTNKTDRHDITEILLKVALNNHRTNKQ
jgi:hypothetical protein